LIEVKGEVEKAVKRIRAKGKREAEAFFTVLSASTLAWCLGA
jgi:hypothetical protein